MTRLVYPITLISSDELEANHGSGWDSTWSYQGELLHCETGPAVLVVGDGIDAGELWFAHGRPHRDGGPALVRTNGEQGWYQNGEPHREDGPALDDTATPSRSWWIRGVRHRIDGPAAINDGERYWFVNGVAIRDEEDRRALFALLDLDEPGVLEAVLTTYTSGDNVEGLIVATRAARTGTA